MRSILTLLALAVSLPGAAVGQVVSNCRIALTLALDVSSSVDQIEYRLQIGGLAEALLDPQVQRAFLQVPGSGVALQVYEWSDVSDQHIIRDWTFVETSSDLAGIAAELNAHPRSFANGKTALGEALSFGLRQLGRAPDCGQMKIDVSGDGQSNAGIPPQSLYVRENFGAVVVNGLAIQSDEEALARYYRNFVIRGDGAFVEEASDFTSYAEAIKRKLIRELGTPQLSLLDE